MCTNMELYWVYGGHVRSSVSKFSFLRPDWVMNHKYFTFAFEFLCMHTGYLEQYIHALGYEATPQHLQLVMYMEQAIY